MDNEYTLQEVQRFRKFGDVTASDVVFDWYLAGSTGAGFVLIREHGTRKRTSRRLKTRFAGTVMSCACE